MDARSFINVLFYVALKKMGMKAKDLRSIVTPLFRFLGNSMQPIGHQVAFLIGLGVKMKDDHDCLHSGRCSLSI